MSVWSRDFTTKEKILLLFLVLVLLGMCYYWFIDQPVRTTIATANADRDAALAELAAVQTDLDHLRAMRDELDQIEHYSYMASYNNSAEELSLLNDILSDTLQYTISFSNVTRSGDQIRRNFSLQVKTANYESMRQIIKTLCEGNLRCMIGDMRCTTSVDLDDPVTINASATFFETMAGGTPDAGLPADSAAEN